MTAPGACEKCGKLIPSFEPMDAAVHARVFELIREGRPIVAARELAAAVGCEASEAELWIAHRGHPHTQDEQVCWYYGREVEAIGGRLRCPRCYQPWYDPAHGVSPDRFEA